MNKRELEKEKKQQRILNASLELFTDKGYYSTSMDDIARQAELTKRTIYKYFQTKENLYYAVTLSCYQEMWLLVENRMDRENKNFNKIEAACFAFEEFYYKKPEILYLMSIGNQINDVEIPSSYEKDYFLFNRVIFDKLLEIFNNGISDGSLRQDLDLYYLTNSFVFSIISFFKLLSLNGKSFIHFTTLDEKEFIRFTISQLLYSIKNN